MISGGISPWMFGIISTYGNINVEISSHRVYVAIIRIDELVKSRRMARGNINGGITENVYPCVRKGEFKTIIRN